MARGGFAGILDECLALLQQGGSVEDCLKRYPEEAEQLRPLLEIADGLRGLGVTPSSEQAAAGRERFLREAVTLAESSVAGGGWRTRVKSLAKEYSGMSMLQRVAVTAATVLVLTLFLGGTVLFVSAHELEGNVEAITTDGADNITSITVGPVTVNVPPGTEFDLVGDLQVGDFVKIQGDWEPDGSLTASEIEEEEADEPEIEDIEPDQGERGDSLVVVITGENTHFDSSSVVSFAPSDGIEIISVMLDGPTSLTVEISIDADAPEGERDVTVTTPTAEGTEEVTEEDGFEVEEADEADHDDEECAADAEDDEADHEGDEDGDDEEGDDEDGDDDEGDDEVDDDDENDDDDDGVECEDEHRDEEEEDDD